MIVEGIDHLVLTVNDIEVTVQFYEKILGMKKYVYDTGRIALLFGTQKLNVHQKSDTIEPRAQQPTIGSVDVCFITRLPIERVVEHLLLHGVSPLQGPVQRSGAKGQMTSVYIRDPDGNLVEIAYYNDIDYSVNLE